MRLVTPRKLLLAFLAVGFAQLAVKAFPEAKRRYVAWRFPPMSPVQAGADIAGETTRRLQLHVQSLAARADPALEAARARGDDVSAVEALRRQAAAASAVGDYRKAADLLNQVIAKTPAEPVGMIPISKREADEEQIEQDLPGKKTKEFVDSGLGPAPRKARRRR